MDDIDISLYPTIQPQTLSKKKPNTPWNKNNHQLFKKN